MLHQIGFVDDIKKMNKLSSSSFNQGKTLFKTFLFVVLLLIVMMINWVEAITCPNGVDNINIQTNWVMQAQYGAFQAAVEMGFYDNECLNVVIKLGMLSCILYY